MPTPKDKNRLTIVIVILVILVTGILFLRRTRLALLNQSLNKTSGLEATITPQTLEGIYSVNPPRLIKNIGDQFSLDIIYNVGETKLDGADAIVRFDPALLEVTDITEGKTFESYPRKTIDNVKGLVKVTGFREIENERTRKDNVFFSLAVTAKRTGAVKVQFDFEKDKTNLSTLVESKSSRNILGQTKFSAINIVTK